MTGLWWLGLLVLAPLAVLAFGPHGRLDEDGPRHRGDGPEAPGDGPAPRHLGQEGQR